LPGSATTAATANAAATTASRLFIVRPASRAKYGPRGQTWPRGRSHFPGQKTKNRYRMDAPLAALLAAQQAAQAAWEALLEREEVRQLSLRLGAPLFIFACKY